MVWKDTSPKPAVDFHVYYLENIVKKLKKKKNKRLYFLKKARHVAKSSEFELSAPLFGDLLGMNWFKLFRKRFFSFSK